ncbi:MAG: RidA family protein [Acidimicrobiia bacterium]|nr:RidA family protein [Acidimicrobiia bacterium]
MKKINVEGIAKLPTFSHATIAGDTIYVSGSLGTLPGSMDLAPGGIGPETAQTLQNIETILNACGAGVDDIVKVNVYLTDMSGFSDMNTAYLAYFGESPPARITVGVAELALGASVEIDCIAHAPTSS